MSLILKDLRVVGRWVPGGKERIIREVRIADIVEVLESEGAVTVVDTDSGFLAQPEDPYTPLYVGEPGRYLVFRLDEEE